MTTNSGRCPGARPTTGMPGGAGCLPRFFFSARSDVRRCFRDGLRPGRSSELGGIDGFPLFRDPARSAVASRSRRSAPIASSAAICSACAASRRSCSLSRFACSWISASRGSAGSSPATARSRYAIIPETSPGNQGNTAPDAET